MAKPVMINKLKPGRKFTFHWTDKIEGELVRLDSGSAVVNYRRVDTMREIDDTYNDVEVTKTRYEKLVSISLESMVLPKNRKG